VRCFYIMYMARYTEEIITVCLESKRKDFAQMLLHHCLTVVLTCISYLFGWNRVGVVVMDDEGNQWVRWQFLADRLFEIFALVFFFTRLVMYGYVCWSAHIEATRYFPKGLPEWTCVVLLYSLYFLQVYWFHLILKVAMRL